MIVGYGQWARVLHDKHGLDVMAFDSMTNLPSITTNDNSTSSENLLAVDTMKNYVYSATQKGTEQILGRQVTDYTHPEMNISKRALMIIYPDERSQMAHNSLVKYSNNDSLIWNDLFIYVGEGRNGANGTKEFFDLLEGVSERGKMYKWKLVYTCKLNPFGGYNQKGFERLFIFKRELKKPKMKYVHSDVSGSIDLHLKVDGSK